MSDNVAFSAFQAVQRFRRQDATLQGVHLANNGHTDGHLAELVNFLLARPGALTYIDLSDNQLTDETGVKLARCLAASTTIYWLNVTNNRFGDATYLAIAAALRANKSLQYLYMYSNQPADRRRIDAAFAEALWLNSDRSARLTLSLYSYGSFEWERLREAVAQLGHPSLQLLLAAVLHANECVDFNGT